MAITINGSANTVAGLAVGGLPDGVIDNDSLANTTITAAKIAADTITASQIAANAVGDSELNATTGKVLKVYHSNSVSTRTSTDGDTWLDTYLSVAMDAFGKSSNKLLVQFELHCGLFGDTTYDYASQRMNNIGTRIVWTPSGGSDTVVFENGNDASGHYDFRFNMSSTSTDYNNMESTLSRSALISPGTTTAITVKVQFKCGKDNMSTQVHAGGRSTMTVWELDY